MKLSGVLSRSRARVRAFRKFAAALLACLAVSAAAAAAADGTRTLYVKGDYAAAIASGEQDASGEALALAARATLAEANIRDRPCLPCLDRAEALARRAIAAEPGRVESYVLLAVSLGYKARLVGMLRARLANYGEQAKQALETALRLAPADPSALAALGGWHIEVVRIGGALGTALYGARVQTGQDYYRRGIAADPGNLVLPYQYALSLSGYDLAAHRQDVAALLGAAAAGTPRTAYDGVLKTRAARLLELLRENDTRAALQLVNRYQGYP
jgi:hypothetical protein